MVNEGATEVTSSSRVAAEFIAGETTKLDLGGTGRPVIGKLLPSVDFEGKVLWNFAMVKVRTDLKRPDFPDAPSEAQDDPQARAAWWKEWKETDPGKAYLTEAKAYEAARAVAPFLNASVGRDGSFRIDDTTAGNYELSVHADRRLPGSLRGYRFTVSAMPNGRSDEPLNLGELPPKTRNGEHNKGQSTSNHSEFTN